MSIILIIYGYVSKDACVGPGFRLPRAGSNDDGVSVWSSGEHAYILFGDFTLKPNPTGLN